MQYFSIQFFLRSLIQKNQRLSSPAIHRQFAFEVMTPAPYPPDTVMMETGQISESLLRTGCVFPRDLPGCGVATFAE
jgi:hypothetical protein